jgi:hypothetical protein
MCDGLGDYWRLLLRHLSSAGCGRLKTHAELADKKNKDDKQVEESSGLPGHKWDFHIFLRLMA